MRRRSKKTQAIYDEMREAREEYIYQIGRCVNPECSRNGTLTVHEITNGQNRMAGFREPTTWLCLCSRCNCEEFTNKDRWPIVSQIAIKKWSDPERYNLDAVAKILGREDITEETVSALTAELRTLYGDPFAARRHWREYLKL